MRFVYREFDGDVAVEFYVSVGVRGGWGGRGGGWRDPVEVGSWKASYVGVGEELAVLGRGGVVEGG
jgi:hypothetical protein